MRRGIVHIVGLLFIVAMSGLVWPDLHSRAHAQAKCKSFHAIAQAALPTSTPLAGSDVWGGPLQGTLGGGLLFGVFSGNDGVDTWRGPGGAMGQGRGGSYTVCTDYPACTDSFTYEVPTAMFPGPPGQKGIGFYIGNTASIVGGTGRFATASGSLNVVGPAFAWPDNNEFGFSGRWNAELSGQICGID